MRISKFASLATSREGHPAGNPPYLRKGIMYGIGHKAKYLKLSQYMRIRWRIVVYSVIPGLERALSGWYTYFGPHPNFSTNFPAVPRIRRMVYNNYHHNRSPSTRIYHIPHIKYVYMLWVWRNRRV